MEKIKLKTPFPIKRNNPGIRKVLKGEFLSKSVVILKPLPSGSKIMDNPAGMAPIATNNWSKPKMRCKRFFIDVIYSKPVCFDRSLVFCKNNIIFIQTSFCIAAEFEIKH